MLGEFGQWCKKSRERVNNAKRIGWIIMSGFTISYSITTRWSSTYELHVIILFAYIDGLEDVGELFKRTDFECTADR